jgi:hypothetical protein
MRRALVVVCAALGLAISAAAKDRFPEYEIQEIPIGPLLADLPPAPYFDQAVTALNEHGQIVVILSISRPHPTNPGERLHDHYEGRFWNGREWLPIASGSSEVYPLDLNNRGEVLVSTFAIESYAPFTFDYSPIIWRRGTMSPLPLPFENAFVSRWITRGDFAGYAYTQEPVYTNENGSVITAPVSHPFLFRNGAWVELSEYAAKPSTILLNHRGDALVGGEDAHQFTLLTHKGALPLTAPDGWETWPYLMGGDSFAGDFAFSNGPNGWNENGFVYRNGSWLILSRTNENIRFSPVAMNDRGDVVGSAKDEDDEQWPDDVSGFLFRDGELRLIQELVPQNTDWKLFFPTTINNRGQMSGFARRNGRLAIYLLTPRQR